ncbi:Transmembrane protein 63C [Arachnomyces sp. PD_36]|nr:Transmembrane protein 63C [Arachnomyces sp. PD_36]
MDNERDIEALKTLMRREAAGDQFLELIQNPFKSAFQVNAVWVSLGTYIGITIVLALLFSLFRPRNSVVYAPKVKHADEKHTPPPIGKGLFAWVKPVIKTKEHELADMIGLDAVVFLRFAKMCRNIFLVLSVIGCLVMIPINISESDEWMTKGLSAFATMTPMYVFSQALWSHVACAWGFDIIVGYFLWRNYKAVTLLRKQYFQSSEYQRSLHARTLMITDIPPSYRSDGALLRLTDEVNPTSILPQTTIGRNVKELPAMIAEHNKLVRQLETVLAKYLKRPDRLPAHRPTIRPAKKHKSNYQEEKVDAIDYLMDRIQDLEVKIKDVRETIDKRNAMSYGFASWESIENAHAVAYSARRKHPQGTTIRLAPRPNDVIWENIGLTKSAKKWKRFINMIWVSLLTVAWIAPNALIAVFLSDLSNLGLVWDTFQTSFIQNPKFWAAVQGIASPAITSLIYLVLPIIFRRLAFHAGDTTKTSRERHVIHHLYAFFVFNNLVVFSIFSAVWGFVSAVVEAEKTDENAWEAIRHGEFYVKVMTSLCQISPFWVSWLLARNLGAAIDIVQVVNLFWIWFVKTFQSPTPRERIELTAPPPFDYASYYNYFLFYSTVALCFATLQPMVLPVAALYFGVDAWLKKYLLMYVFITKTESAGRFWRVLFNRFIFAMILSNCIIALVVKARGTWTMVFSLAPLPFLVLGFKFYCSRKFDDDCHYITGKGLKDPEAVVSAKSSKKAQERLSVRYCHPALSKPLPTPMVHQKAVGALKEITRGRLNESGRISMTDYTDIALHPMSSTQPGRAKEPSSDAPFEVVGEDQLDFTYFRDRAYFRDEFGGGLYGSDDIISERSGTPRPGFPYSSAGSSRASSPSNSVDLRTKRSQQFDTASLSAMDHPAALRPSFSRGASETDIPVGGGAGGGGGGFYQQSNESERRLLSNVQMPPAAEPYSGHSSRNPSFSLDQFGGGGGGRYAGYGPAPGRPDDDHDDGMTSYDYYRGRR